MNRLPSSRVRIAHLLLAAVLLATAGLEAQQPAPKPLFRDPVHDGAADPTLIYNRARHEWWMFYTNRRADLATDNPKDVAWVHGTRIGIAVSKDRGAHWTYKGEAAIPYGAPDYTHWAPDIVFRHAQYHMFLTIVPGTFKDWNAPREIVHLTSPDLEHWTYVSKIDSGSDRIIDPSLYQLPTGAWRVWFKNERDHSHLYSSDSTDLIHWTPATPVITDRSSEAPKVFRWHDRYWMITDPWRGLGVYSSTDLEHWTHQPQNILQAPGTLPTDRTEAHHCDVVVHDGHAYIYYFTHQKDADLDPKLPHSEDRTVLQVAELELEGDTVTVHRDQPVKVDLGEGEK